MTEEKVNELEDQLIEITQSENQREKRWGEKNEQSLRDLCSNTKRSGIGFNKVPERKEIDCWIENTFEEITARNALNLAEDRHKFKKTSKSQRE